VCGRDRAAPFPFFQVTAKNDGTLNQGWSTLRPPSPTFVINEVVLIAFSSDLPSNPG